MLKRDADQAGLEEGKPAMKEKASDASATSSLPSEMISLILNRLSNDKHTLSTCMRVSSTWNAIAAPILYQTVRVTYSASGQRSNPLSLPKVPADGKIEDLPSRLSASKIQNAKHVRHLIVDDHQSRCVGLVNDARYPELSVSSVRLHFDVLEKDDVRAPHWHCGCFCTDKFVTDKVVLFGISPIFSVPNPMDTDTVISVFNREHEPISNLGYDYPEEEANECRRAIYIYWTPRRDDSYYREWDLWDGKPEGYTMWDLFVNLMVKNAWTSPRTEEAIVVNIDCVNRAYKGENRPDMAKILQDEVNNEKPEEAEEDATFKIKFVTMEDYFKNYDWAGEFTEEEVAENFSGSGSGGGKE